MFNNPTVKAVVGALGVAVLGFAALYWKNSALEKETKPLDKQQVIHMLKLIRKKKYAFYKQIATFAVNISRQMRGNINSLMIQQFLDGPESPLKIKVEFEKIVDQVCNDQKTTIDAFNTALQTFKTEEAVFALVKQQQHDLQTSLAGKIPAFQVQIPQTFDKETFLRTQNLFTKKTYLHQAAIFKKLTQFSEQEIQQNPAILGEFSTHEQQLEDILVDAGLDSLYDPPFAIYERASIKYRNDPAIRPQIAKIEEGYQKILNKYTMKIQNKTIRPEELDQLEDQVMFYDPLVV